MDSEEMFEDQQLRSNSFDAFYEMVLKGEFCDITVKFGNRTVCAHRNVLAAGIPYFREKLASQNIETDLNEISGCNLEDNALESLIEFSYTGKIHLTTENVRTLLHAASFLRIDSVIDACCEFIVVRMKPEEALSVRQLAESVASSKLLKSIDAYVCYYFDEVSTCEVFLDAPLSYVKELICRDELQYSKEETVLNFVLKWVKTSPDERKVCLVELLSEVRMALVDPDYLTDFLEDDMIVSSIPCRNILKDARTFHFLPHRRAMISSFKTSPRGTKKQRPKGSEKWTPGIYGICCLTESSSDLPTQILKYFDTISKEWSIVDVLSFTLHSVSSSLIQCNGKFYFYDSDYIRAYDPPIGGWSSKSSFYVGQRFNAGITVSKNMLYICGGTASDTLAPLNTVICFDFEKNSRTFLCMPFSVAHLGAVSLNDNLYVLGGKNEKNACSKSVSRYDIREGQWKDVPSMTYPRCAMGCAVLDGKIYVCGGMSTTYNAPFEVFNPLLNKWVYLSKEYPGPYVSLIPYGRKLYMVRRMFEEIGYGDELTRLYGLIGQRNFGEEMKTYDPETNKWYHCCYLPINMTFLRATSME